MFASAESRKAPGDSWIHHTLYQESDTTREEDITMFRFMQRFGRDSQARGRGTGPLTRARRRNHQLNCEALEGRQMLSGFYLANAYSGKVLDDPAGSINLGAVIDQYQITGSANQQWQIGTLSNGYSRILNTQSGQVLIDTGHSTSGASSIEQWAPLANVPAEQWLVYSQANGTVEIQNRYTGKFLDDPNFSRSNLTGMIDYPWNGGINQQWNMVAAGSGPSVIYSLQNQSSGLVLNNLLLIPLADGNDLIVDIGTGGGVVTGDGDGNSVTGYEGITGTLNQQWYIAPQGNGYVAIVNASDYTVLDQTGPETIVLDGWYGGPSQQWQFGDPAY
jgi:Ricin-type beta-trefoil lectin domain-like